MCEFFFVYFKQTSFFITHRCAIDFESEAKTRRENTIGMFGRHMADSHDITRAKLGCMWKTRQIARDALFLNLNQPKIKRRIRQNGKCKFLVAVVFEMFSRYDAYKYYVSDMAFRINTHMYICINHENAKINQTLNDFARTRVQLLGCRYGFQIVFFRYGLHSRVQ